MTTAIQNNGIESLANGNIGHVEVSESNMAPESLSTTSTTEKPTEPEPPEIDIVINNVVCSFSVRCHLNLRQIALTGANVEYRRENGVCFQSLLMWLLNTVYMLVLIFFWDYSVYCCYFAALASRGQYMLLRISMKV